MGIDRSLTDEFPFVIINGRRYHYGRESTFGCYLVESAEYAKDYWCFETAEDLRAFLVSLPESADNEWIMRRRPDWHEVSARQRDAYEAEHRRFLRGLMKDKRKAERAEWIRVLAFDEDAINCYCVYAHPLDNRDDCDDLEVGTAEQKGDSLDGKESRVELRVRPGAGAQRQPLKITKAQALRLASVLIRVATDRT